MAALSEPVFLLNLNPLFTSKNPYPIHFLNLPKLPSKPLVIATCCATTPSSSPSPSFPQDSDQNPLQTSPERTRDRRKVVRLAWEKLVRWSRSWRSKAKTDVLERTKKVFHFSCFLLPVLVLCLFRNFGFCFDRFQCRKIFWFFLFFFFFFF